MLRLLHSRGEFLAESMPEIRDMINEVLRPIWVDQGIYEQAGICGELFAVVGHYDAKRKGSKTISCGHNLIVDTGDIYYAERGGNAVTPTAPTNFTVANLTFDGVLEMGTAGTPGKGDDRSDMTAISSSQKVIDSGYPTLSDGDSDNPGTVGVDIITYRVSYTAGDFNDAAITNAIITNPSPGATEAILCHGTVSSFPKTSSDTLKFFWNHQMNGV